jgi:hypothetical protein
VNPPWSAATPIVVANGANVENIEFVLDPQRIQRDGFE